MSKIHIAEIAARGLLQEISQRFGINLNCIFPLQWWLELPGEFVEYVYDHPSEMKISYL